MDLPTHDNDDDNNDEYNDEYDDDDDDDDDEFFGSQEDDFHSHYEGSAAIREFGTMSEHEIDARRNELKNIAFLEAYDDFKESRLQEGFERGFLDSFAVGTAIGTLLGEATTWQAMAERHDNSSSSSSSHNNEKNSSVNENDSVSPGGGGGALASSRNAAGSAIAALVHDYFANEFQKDLDCNNGIQGLEALASKTENYSAVAVVAEDATR